MTTRAEHHATLVLNLLWLLGDVYAHTQVVKCFNSAPHVVCDDRNTRQFALHPHE